MPFDELIRNALILAKKNDYDVYNCLNLMDNASVFEDLHFQIGDGNLNYYLYNWIMKCKKIQPNQLGVVLFWLNDWLIVYLFVYTFFTRII